MQRNDKQSMTKKVFSFIVFSCESITKEIIKTIDIQKQFKLQGRYTSRVGIQRKLKEHKCEDKARMCQQRAKLKRIELVERISNWKFSTRTQITKSTYGSKGNGWKQSKFWDPRVKVGNSRQQQQQIQVEEL